MDAVCMHKQSEHFLKDVQSCDNPAGLWKQKNKDAAMFLKPKNPT